MNKQTAILAGAAVLAMAGTAAADTSAPKTIRQIEGERVMRENSTKVAQIFAHDKTGETAAAQALYDTLSDGMKRGVDNARAARDGKLDEKSQAQVDQTRALYAAVKSGDVEAMTTAFGKFSPKAQKGVLKPLQQMAIAGRVTPEIAEAIGKLAA